MACDRCERMRRDMWATFKDWYTQPFRTDMDVPHWFAFFGLMLALGIAWGLVFRTIREVA